MGDLPNVTSEKPAVPVLWLDTVVVVKLTKVERGEALETVEIQRITKLRDLVDELVRSGKLKRTYEEQLKEEQRGYADALAQRVEEFEEKIHRGIAPDFEEFMGVQGFLMFKLYWRDLGGKPSGLKGVHSFFCSSYFHNLPTPRIRQQLGADLLTGNQTILSGDMMDVEMLSVAIPVAHFVLTDKKMADRIRRRGIHEEWGTGVYSLSEISGLFEKLEALR